MSWAKLDDRFPRHRRVQQLDRDVAAKWLHVVAICHCAEHLTDGILDHYAIRQIVADANIPASTARRCIPKLVAAGLWIERNGVYAVNDYLDYNPHSDEVKAKREQAKNRMRTLRAVRTNNQ